jgi:hypothetical protein
MHQAEPGTGGGTGKPTCGACGVPLPWIVDTTGTLLDRIAVAAGHAGVTSNPRTGRVLVGNHGGGVVSALTTTR